MAGSGTMNDPMTAVPPRVAISLDMDWAYKRHLEVYAGCQRYADEAGWEISINPAVGRMLADDSQAFPYAGVIARADQTLATAARRRGVPLVNVWTNSPAKGVPSVLPDWKASGTMAAGHLLSRGFRHFAHLGFHSDIDSRLQFLGFQETILAAGHGCGSHRISRAGISGSARGWEGFVRETGDWIDNLPKPVGVLVIQDLICRYFIEICRHKGLQVSQQVAVVGTHNETEICLSPPPSLSSIDMSYGQVGYRAAAMLASLMSGQPLPQETEWVAPAELVSRQSTDSCASVDPMVTRALRFIAENSQRRIQVKDVASAVAASRRTLERRFREALGRAVADEITRLRLERAKRRIVETDALLKDVARDSGFRSADHFYKVFARVEGMPPTEYRQIHQKAFPRAV